MTRAGAWRLILYILIGSLPELINWLTLTFDLSPRGIAILIAKLTLAACITWRAFIDANGKQEEEQPAIVIEAQAPPKHK